MHAGADAAGAEQFFEAHGMTLLGPPLPVR